MDAVVTRLTRSQIIVTLANTHDMPFKFCPNFWLIFFKALLIDKQSYENYAIAITVEEGASIRTYKVPFIIQRLKLHGKGI